LQVGAACSDGNSQCPYGLKHEVTGSSGRGREDENFTGRLEAGLLDYQLVTPGQLRAQRELPVLAARGAKYGATVRRSQYHQRVRHRPAEGIRCSSRGRLGGE
jgi:hypothetical protein